MDIGNELSTFFDALYNPMLPRAVAVDELPDDALVLGVDPDTSKPVFVTMEDLVTSLVIAGGTNSGKSNAIRALLRALLKRAKRHREGFAVVDVHGNLANWLLLAIAQHYPELAPRVFYADFAQQHGKVLGCNLLVGAANRPHFAAGSITEILLRTYGAHGTAERPLVARVLHNLASALIALELPLTHARYFLERGARELAVFRSLLRQLPEASAVRSFWEDFAAKAARSPATADSYVLGPSNRISPLIAPPACRRMLAAPVASVDCRALMDQGGIAIFNLSRMNADVTLDAQLAFAGLICQAFRQRFEERRPDRSRPFTLVADEFGLYAPTNSFSDILVGARKYNLRTATAFQALSQLIPTDGNRTLHDTILAVPCKLIMGNLPFADCKVLAEESYLRAVDPNRVKHQHERTVWDPVLRKVVVTSHSQGGSEGESESTTETHAQGHSRSETRAESEAHSSSDARAYQYEAFDLMFRSSTNSGGSQTTNGASRGVSDTDSEVQSTGNQRGRTRQTSWSETESEQWITDHEKRIEQLPPQFSPLEEQIFEAAKHLKLGARGSGVLVRPAHEPADVRVNYMPDINLAIDDIQHFLAEVFDKPVYLPAEEVDRLLEEREQRVLTEAARGAQVLGSTSGRKKKTAIPVPSGLFSDAEED